MVVESVALYCTWDISGQINDIRLPARYCFIQVIL